MAADFIGRAKTPVPDFVTASIAEGTKPLLRMPLTVFDPTFDPDSVRVVVPAAPGVTPPAMFNRFVAEAELLEIEYEAPAPWITT